METESFKEMKKHNDFNFEILYNIYLKLNKNNLELFGGTSYFNEKLKEKLEDGIKFEYTEIKEEPEDKNTVFEVWFENDFELDSIFYSRFHCQIEINLDKDDPQFSYVNNFIEKGLLITEKEYVEDVLEMENLEEPVLIRNIDFLYYKYFLEFYTAIKQNKKAFKFKKSFKKANDTFDENQVYVILN